ncbi:hypothetical protein A2803_04580 [Candidatus Woesebacteria bacterium RIFCSPHIGHO2_01_FULL_44_21]|uniref:Uncharacterized protein n=1 Tax=Candidatus Woesebacteria bacterium RIFCSPHIGHO2_01_FULL_44_21 TaxID=1802503 RepID=A0A1F7YWM6_9BACT|nr:MAG: hypothetical protein A2803_04580 [Candidatus Woesebacteria bacterium RIFCSPHIGHO2_01_FULL_44_21]OGM71348.1 MAG: hypothetical protein A2897_00945 [Candidatus Woesebacteria bacterium RIFCSPLOWO2_01_FULL_44_24b]
MEQIKTVAVQPSVIAPQPATPALDEKVVKKLPIDNNAKVKFVVIGLVVVAAGVLTGRALSGVSAEGGQATPTANVSENPEGATVDESVFADSAQGTLHEGGIEGEGTHYLDTGAGAEKYVYLLSTVLDLDPFIDKKVEVFGQTLAAEHAGWLMDVGRVKEIQ